MNTDYRFWTCVAGYVAHIAVGLACIAMSIWLSVRCLNGHTWVFQGVRLQGFLSGPGFKTCSKCDHMVMMDAAEYRHATTTYMHPFELP